MVLGYHHLGNFHFCRSRKDPCKRLRPNQIGFLTQWLIIMHHVLVSDHRKGAHPIFCCLSPNFFLPLPLSIGPGPRELVASLSAVSSPGLTIGPQGNVCARMGHASFGLMKAPLLVVLNQDIHQQLFLGDGSFYPSEQFKSSSVGLWGTHLNKISIHVPVTTRFGWYKNEATKT